MFEFVLGARELKKTIKNCSLKVLLKLYF